MLLFRETFGVRLRIHTRHADLLKRREPGVAGRYAALLVGSVSGEVSDEDGNGNFYHRGCPATIALAAFWFRPRLGWRGTRGDGAGAGPGGSRGGQPQAWHGQSGFRQHDYASYRCPRQPDDYTHRSRRRQGTAACCWKHRLEDCDREPDVGCRGGRSRSGFGQGGRHARQLYGETASF